MQNLPEDVLKHIYNYISFHYLVNLNKYYYTKYNHQKREYISKSLFNSYIRNTIRKNHDFILKNIIVYHSKLWMNSKPIIYHQIKYKTFYAFLLQYSLENNSTKCYHLLKNINIPKIKEHKNVLAKKYKWKY